MKKTKPRGSLQDSPSPVSIDQIEDQHEEARYKHRQEQRSKPGGKIHLGNIKCQQGNTWINSKQKGMEGDLLKPG
jgi:hypothetical protein